MDRTRLAGILKNVCGVCFGIAAFGMYFRIPPLVIPGFLGLILIPIVMFIEPGTFRQKWRFYLIMLFFAGFFALMFITAHKR